MSARQYTIRLIIIFSVFPFTVCRPIGILAFAFLSIFYGKVLASRWKETEQRHAGITALLLWFIGGGMLHLFALNAQLHFLPDFTYRIFGPGGVLTFGVGILFALSLIRDRFTA